MKKVLPIGAVVLLKGATEPLMIVGYLAKGKDEKEKDYIGVVYPIGYINLDSVFTFNEEDIKEIVFFGNENNEFFRNFSKKIKKHSKKNDTI